MSLTKSNKRSSKWAIYSTRRWSEIYRSSIRRQARGVKAVELLLIISNLKRAEIGAQQRETSSRIQGTGSHQASRGAMLADQLIGEGMTQAETRIKVSISIKMTSGVLQLRRMILLQPRLESWSSWRNAKTSMIRTQNTLTKTKWLHKGNWLESDMLIHRRWLESIERRNIRRRSKIKWKWTENTSRNGAKPSKIWFLSNKMMESKIIRRMGQR